MGIPDTPNEGNQSPAPTLIPPHKDQPPLLQITLEEVKNILHFLPTNKAPGADQISNLILKNLPDCTLELITQLFNRSIKKY